MGCQHARRISSKQPTVNSCSDPEPTNAASMQLRYQYYCQLRVLEIEHTLISTLT